MSKQARELRKLRAWLGLTQEDAALKAGTKDEIKAGMAHKNDNKQKHNSGSNIRSSNRSSNRKEKISSICSIFENPVERSRAAIARTFTIGSCYQVVSEKRIINRLKAGEKYAVQTVSESSDDPEFGFTFRYLGKQGIHHVFIEISCGWYRTYTDAQLVGKEVVEVSEAEVRRLRKSLMQAEVKF